MTEPVRFFAGGGQPPRSHEVLLVQVGGPAWYLTGMPWPAQPPFDEIGAYRTDLGPPAYERLAALARAAIAAPEAPAGRADAGSESVSMGDARADWGPRTRPPEAEALVRAAREAIAAVRAEPYAVARATLVDGGARVRLANPGTVPLPVRGVEVRANREDAADRAPSPWDFTDSPSAPLELPGELAPGDAVEVDLPATAVHALLHLTWHPPVDGERDWLDGWLIAGPAA